jgi:GntR family transcriptional regulator of arabinose operon
MKSRSLVAGKIPKYAHIVEAIQADIAEGRLRPNDRLPSFVEMVERFGVAKQTVDKAHAILEQEGLIRREQGRGVFVEPPQKKVQTGFIGYLDPDLTYTSRSSYFRQIHDGVRRAAGESGKNLVIIDSHKTFTRWSELEGLLLCEVEDADLVDIPVILPSDLPVVNLLYNCPFYPSVQAADEAGIHMLVEHLVQLGHRRIASVTHINHIQLRSRHQAYREALLRHGIEPQPEWSFHRTGWGFAYSLYGYDMMRLWLQEGWAEAGCTAIVAQNDLMAHGIAKALIEVGIKVPEDVSIVGFDGVVDIGHDGVNESYIQPMKLTTVKVPLYDIGYTAMKVLLGENDVIPVLQKPIKMPVELVVGNSSAPCKTANYAALKPTMAQAMVSRPGEATRLSR